MTTIENNEPINRPTAMQVLATVQLLAHNHRLPNPFRVAADNGGRDGHLSIDLDAHAALFPWIEAIGILHERINQTQYENNRRGYWVHAMDWPAPGWSVQVKAVVKEPEVTAVELDADTVASLEEVAKGATEQVETRVSDDRVDEIVSVLNGFIVHEYEPVSDIVYGRAVHSREITGSDWNLDQAVAWAHEQPDVVEALGPNADGEAVVELDDGTTIEWDTASKSWGVTVSDECDAPEVSR